MFSFVSSQDGTALINVCLINAASWRDGASPALWDLQQPQVQLLFHGRSLQVPWKPPLIPRSSRKKSLSILWPSAFLKQASDNPTNPSPNTKRKWIQGILLITAPNTKWKWIQGIPAELWELFSYLQAHNQHLTGAASAHFLLQGNEERLEIIQEHRAVERSLKTTRSQRYFHSAPSNLLPPVKWFQGSPAPNYTQGANASSGKSQSIRPAKAWRKGQIWGWVWGGSSQILPSSLSPQMCVIMENNLHFLPILPIPSEPVESPLSSPPCWVQSRNPFVQEIPVPHRKFRGNWDWEESVGLGAR